MCELFNLFITKNYTSSALLEFTLQMGKLKLRKFGAYRKPQILTLNYGSCFSQEPVDMKCVCVCVCVCVCEREREREREKEREREEGRVSLAKQHANKDRH